MKNEKESFNGIIGNPPKEPKKIKALVDCKICGKKVSQTSSTCPYCGESAPGLYIKCPKCGSMNISSEKKRFWFR